MMELLHGWKDDPNTLAWLKTLPGFNELRNVDKETTAALAAPLEDDSGTINWLEELANSKKLADTDLAATIRLFLKPLEKLKAGYSIFIYGNDLAIQDRGAQFQFRYRFGDRREFLFQWQTVPGPKARLTGCVEDCDCAVSVQLSLIPSRLMLVVRPWTAHANGTALDCNQPTEGKSDEK